MLQSTGHSCGQRPPQLYVAAALTVCLSRVLKGSPFTNTVSISISKVHLETTAFPSSALLPSPPEPPSSPARAAAQSLLGSASPLAPLQPAPTQLRWRQASSSGLPRLLIPLGQEPSRLPLRTTRGPRSQPHLCSRLLPALPCPSLATLILFPFNYFAKHLSSLWRLHVPAPLSGIVRISRIHVLLLCARHCSGPLHTRPHLILTPGALVGTMLYCH